MEQVSARLLEETLISSEKPSLPQEFAVESFIQRNDGFFIKRLRYKEFTLKTTPPNNTVMLRNGQVFQIEKISSVSDSFEKNQIVFKGKSLEIGGPAYTYPTDSSLFNIFKLKKQASQYEASFYLEDLHCTMIHHCIYELESDEDSLSYVMPLMHTFFSSSAIAWLASWLRLNIKF